MRVVMQPASPLDKTVKKHYQDTIATPVVFDEHADLLDPSTLAQLHALFPDGQAQIWGIVPGKPRSNSKAQTPANLSKINKIKPGDWAFFTGDNRAYFGGTIALTWHNPDLARRLWDENGNGQTWEYMYALSDTRTFDIHIKEFRSLLGWNADANVMGITVLDEDKSDLVLEHLTLDAGPHAAAAADPAADEEAIAAYDGELERAATRAARGEQAALKRHLLPGASGTCALCGRHLPKAVLHAAHIKKRSACDEAEKRDLANVAMLACTLGCDALFEHGYVTVDDQGHIQVSHLAADTPDLAAHIKHNNLDGRPITWWNPQREAYYAWHRTHTFKQPG